MPYAYTTDRSFHASSRQSIIPLPLASGFFSAGRTSGSMAEQQSSRRGFAFTSPLNDVANSEEEDRTPALPYAGTMSGRTGTLARTSAMVHKGFYDLLSMLPNTITGEGQAEETITRNGHFVQDDDASDGVARDWQNDPLIGRPYEQTIARAQTRPGPAFRKPVPDLATLSSSSPSSSTPKPAINPSQLSPRPFAPAHRSQPIRSGPGAPQGETLLRGGGVMTAMGVNWPQAILKVPEDWKPLTKPKGMDVIDKRLISWPLEFRHVAHASTDEEAKFMLMRWVMEGQGKVADPLWAKGIREQVKIRAADQQARAIAQVMVAREQGLIQNQPYQTLRVVNGMPSSIYSSTIGGTLRQTLQAAPKPRSSPGLSIPTPSTPRAPLTNPFEATFKPVVQVQGVDPPSQRPGSPPTAPLRLKSKKAVPTVAPDHVVAQRMPQVVSPEEIDGRRFSSHASIMDYSERVDRSFPSETLESANVLVTARDITPSLATLEKAASTAIFFETHYHALLKAPKALGALHANNYMLARERRRLALEEEMELQGLMQGQKQILRSRWLEEETYALRQKRKKVGTHSFVTLKNIGHGAFGVVSLVQEKESGNLFAMKRLRKNDMLRKGQEGHIRAEKDLLAAAASVGSTMSSWIVKLHYSFQDVDHLYLVLAYEGGGDLLNLLIERDTFTEGFTRFYMAELVLALEATHSLGYIHRDIKPDNLLLSNEGHLRVSDFGLAHDTHWSHDTAYYEQQRRALLKRHGIDLEEPSGKQIKTMKRKEVERIMGKEWLDEGEGMLTWRDKKRRTLAFSVCGTNSYMSPEVIRGTGYGFSCDWWSLGIIAFECLYGYPPFVSSSRHVTRQKILNWRQSLRFPTKPKFSANCTDFLAKLICEPEERLGSMVTASPALPNSLILDARMIGSSKGNMKASPSSLFGLQAGDGAAQLKAHPWFAGIDWKTLHLQTPPYLPNLRHPADTQHFDDNIPDRPLAPPDAAPSHATKDPMLADKTHGAQLLELRKGMAFAGWTYKANKMPEHRLAALRELSSADAEENVQSDADSDTTPTASAIRPRAMSF